MLRSIVLAGLLLTTVAVGAERPADPGIGTWTRLSVGKAAEILVDSSGRIWAIHTRHGVRIWTPDVFGEGTVDLPPPEIELEPLLGYEITGAVLADADSLIVIGLAPDTHRSALFSIRPESDADWRLLDIPPMFGRITSIRVDAEGSLWIGGERRETFRFMPAGWKRIMAPAPLHVMSLNLGLDGRLWALAHAHHDNVLLVQRHGIWRTVATIPSHTNQGILYVDHDGAVIETGGEIYLTDGEPDSELTHWFDAGCSLIAVGARDKLWGYREGRLIRFDGDEERDLGLVPFFPHYFLSRAGRLFAHGPSGVWVFSEKRLSSTIDRPLGMLAGRPRYSPGEPLIYGLGVLVLDDQEHLYQARHTQPDAVVPFPGRYPEAPEWWEVSVRLGLDRFDESFRWVESYEMAVAIGDLDGDDQEDVVLATMYDGCRLLRFPGGSRLVPWTGESGLGGYEDHIAEDVDLLDAEGDGDLDVYVSSLQGPDRLYVNDGAAQFRECALESGLISPDASTSTICRDLDADGDTDIAVATSGRGLYIHENLGAGGKGPLFRTRVLLAPISHPEMSHGLSPYQLLGIETADMNGDGLPDIFVGGRTQSLVFLRNEGGLEYREDPSIFESGTGPTGTVGITCFDPDGDGDWDLVCTGLGGARFLENREGRLSIAGDRVTTMFGTDARSTGGVLVDTDGDDDLDFIEAFVDQAPIYYENTNDPSALTICVRGPHGNVSAIGARVVVAEAGTMRPAAPPQEIPGGSGYASHGTRRIVATGLSRDRLYDVHVWLPSSVAAVVQDVPGTGRVEVDMRPGGLTGIAKAALFEVRLAWISRWGRIGLLAVVGAMLAVVFLGLALNRRFGTPVSWPAVAVVPAVVLLVKQFVPPELGGEPVAIATLAGLGTGLLVMTLNGQRPRPRSSSLLAECSNLLKTFDHNSTPRRVVDRIRFIHANSGSTEPPRERAVTLLREDLELYHSVVLPEFMRVVQGAREAGLEVRDGRLALKEIRRNLQGLDLMAHDGLLRGKGLVGVAALLDSTETFRAWVSELRRTVDDLITTRLPDFIDRYADSRAVVHEVEIVSEIEPATIRMAGADLTHVLDVLVENAMRAAEGRRATIRLGSRPTSTGRLQLIVDDDGPGVSKQLSADIFEAGVTDGGGSGYGLFAARRTVERYGGRIWLENGGTGARFVIELDTIQPQGV